MSCWVSVKGSREAGREALNGLARGDKDRRWGCATGRDRGDTRPDREDQVAGWLGLARTRVSLWSLPGLGYGMGHRVEPLLETDGVHAVRYGKVRRMTSPGFEVLTARKLISQRLATQVKRSGEAVG